MPFYYEKKKKFTVIVIFFFKEMVPNNISGILRRCRTSDNVAHSKEVSLGFFYFILLLLPFVRDFTFYDAQVFVAC